MSLRPYQKKAASRIGDFLRDEPSRRLVVMATGTGKTHVVASAASLCVRRFHGGRTLVLVHRDEIVRHLADRARESGLKVGIEMAGETAPRDSQVVVASVQTVGAVRDRISWFRPDLIVVDEAHRTSAPSYRRAIERASGGRKVHHLGVTATPHRLSGVHLIGHDDSPFDADAPLYEFGIRQATSEAWLVDLRGYVVRTDTDLTHVSVRSVREGEGGDFAVAALAEAVNVEVRTAAAFRAWRDLCHDRPTLAFCVDVAHAKSVADFFASQGVVAAVVDGTTPKVERRAILDGYRQGSVQMVCNVGVLTEGIDLPMTACVLMLRPTKSWATFSQMIGRGTRPLPGVVDGPRTTKARRDTIRASGKPDCIVLDVVDLTGRHDVCTVPSLAGLPSRTDLRGATLVRAFEEGERLEVPKELFSAEMTLEELSVEVEARRLVALAKSVPTRNNAIRLTDEMIGKKYGMLTIISDGGFVGKHRSVLCRCDCGNEITRPAAAVRASGYPSCGCAWRAGGRPRKDLTGQVFGRLTTLEPVSLEHGLGWRCRCECGNEKSVPAGLLRSGATRSCGCLQRDVVHAGGPQDNLIGKRYGRLTVLSYTGKTGKSKDHFWHCRCDCGRTKDVRGESLRYSVTASCGCLHREVTSRKNSKLIRDLDGTERPLSEIARLHGVPLANLSIRLRNGWTLERALRQPKRMKRLA